MFKYSDTPNQLGENVKLNKIKTIFRLLFKKMEGWLIKGRGHLAPKNRKVENQTRIATNSRRANDHVRLNFDPSAVILSQNCNDPSGKLEVS
jgi:hypothetical protein